MPDLPVNVRITRVIFEHCQCNLERPIYTILRGRAALYLFNKRVLFMYDLSVFIDSFKRGGVK